MSRYRTKTYSVIFILVHEKSLHTGKVSKHYLVHIIVNCRKSLCTLLEPGYLKYKTSHISGAKLKKKNSSDFIVKMSGGYDETITVTEKDDTVDTFIGVWTFQIPTNKINMQAHILQTKLSE